ncbi:MAG: glycerol-3-phosphate 1-O-acyltransferase PlsY [Spirochaetaceae bacterium]|jgi:glycerol-3-phosphate acyltransferase PlsY|nr:glycerol-3-phosphate 1-O-acyltransferase PlsY [Spirochaetaceae bacterium]
MIFIIMALAYLIGSIPFAIIAGYILTGQDIRTKGSGNAGATNVFRVLGLKAAITVMILDFLKAFIPVFAVPFILPLIGDVSINEELLQIAVLLLIIIGHVFPVWVRFRGGKGVAAAAGGISAIFPPAVPFCLIIFIITVVFTRYISLASLLTAWLLPVYYFVLNQISGRELSSPLMIFFVLVTILITIFHKGNLKRLMKGEESKINFK